MSKETKKKDKRRMINNKKKKKKKKKRENESMGIVRYCKFQKCFLGLYESSLLSYVP